MVRTYFLKLICAEEGKTQERHSRDKPGQWSAPFTPVSLEMALSWEILWWADKLMGGSRSFFGNRGVEVVLRSNTSNSSQRK
jgi:hypothetical protein